LEIIRKILKPAALFFAFHLLMLSGLCQSAWAAMISTESVIKTQRSQSPREYLNTLIEREDMRAALVSRGIDPQEAQRRIDLLSDDEIAIFAHENHRLPAGAGFFEAFIILAFLAFLILLVTDISGYTDAFPFVKKQASKQTARDERRNENSVGKNIQPSVEDQGINPADALIIYFNPDSNDLTATAIESLDQVARYMADDTRAKINIIGFSDSSDSSSYDILLSESRANAVKNYLIAKGVDPTKMSALGLGSQGFSPNGGSEQERQMIGGVVIEFNPPSKGLPKDP
jgi:outer membrane protein OmpA-like peptidoglycan-associated protein